MQATVTSFSKKKGKNIKRPARLVATLKDKLANLHLLLRVPSFGRWPLQIRFFREDVYNAWKTWLDETDIPLRESIQVVEDFQGGTEASDHSYDQARVSALNVSYISFKSCIEKSLMMANMSTLSCSCCLGKVIMSSENILVCPKERCYGVSHLACLSSAFLGINSEELVPIDGECPKCRSVLQWTHLVQELALRTRGEKELARIMRPKRRRAGTTDNQPREDIDELAEEDEINPECVIDEPSFLEAEKWDGSVASSLSDSSNEEDQAIHHSNTDRGNELSIMIEDSEDSDNWHILD